MRELLCKIKVGTAGNEKVFHVERYLIRQVFPFFNDVLSSPKKNEVYLENHEPKAFDVALKWILRYENPEIYSEIKQSEEPWLSYGANICLLAIELRCVDFEREALSNFMRFCALAPFGPWEDIERKAPQESTLLRFSNHWVAWNHYLAGCGKNEYTCLKAATLASQVTDHTRDPRVYDIEHWFSSCGDSISPGCSHDPVSRLEKMQRKALRRKLVPGPKELLEAQQERALQQTNAFSGKEAAMTGSKIISKSTSHTSQPPSVHSLFGPQKQVATRRSFSTSTVSRNTPASFTGMQSQRMSEKSPKSSEPASLNSVSKTLKPKQPDTLANSKDLLISPRQTKAAKTPRSSKSSLPIRPAVSSSSGTRAKNLFGTPLNDARFGNASSSLRDRRERYI